MALRTDYKDDILDTSVNEKRKYNLITNSDGTVSLEDVTEYSQVGDSFGGADINRTNEEINRISYIEVEGTLLAGTTSITLTNSTITIDSRFDFYTSIYGVSPTNVVVAAGSITLTFDAQETDMNVEVRVM